MNSPYRYNNPIYIIIILILMKLIDKYNYMYNYMCYCCALYMLNYYNSDNKNTIKNDFKNIKKKDINLEKASITYNNNSNNKNSSNDQNNFNDTNNSNTKNTFNDTNKFNNKNTFRNKKKIDISQKKSIVSSKYKIINKPQKENITSNDDKTFCEVPLVLKECILEIPLKHNFKFNEKVLSINKINYSIEILNYHILKENINKNCNSKNSNSICHIFMKGFLTRNVQYTCCEEINDEYINSSFKQLTEKIPFECNSTVNLHRYALNNFNDLKIELKEVYIDELYTIHKTPFFNESPAKINFYNQYLINNIESKILLQLRVILTENTLVSITNP